VLADINLGEGGSGIDAVSEILSRSEYSGDFHHRPIRKKLLTGERPNPPISIANLSCRKTGASHRRPALFFHPRSETGRLIGLICFRVFWRLSWPPERKFRIHRRQPPCALREDLRRSGRPQGPCRDVGADRHGTGRIALKGAKMSPTAPCGFGGGSGREAKVAAGESARCRGMAQEMPETLRTQVANSPSPRC